MKISSDYKKLIEENFSKRARLYDEYADIQQAAASSLIKEIVLGSMMKILEIGCGTGNYTRLLRERFDRAHIVALDRSGRMVEMARNKLKDERIEFIVADAEDLGLDWKFDLITSNAAFQWFENLEDAIEKYRHSLNEKGTLLFSTFGPMTFSELGSSLKEALGQGAAIDSAYFAGKDEINAMLAKHFKDNIVKETVIKETLPSLMALLNKIRYTGARGRALNNLFLWKRDIIDTVEEIYKERFGNIEVSYQIFFCKAMI